jgi:adenylate kinase
MKTPEHSSHQLPDLALFGPQGSGKGTQAERLIKEFGFSHVEMGALLREAAKEDSDRGRLIKQYQDEGKIVPKDIVEEVLIEKIKENVEAGKRMLFDGVPRTPEQKQRLDEIMAEVGRALPEAILLELDREESEKRMISRGRPDDLKPEVRENRLNAFYEKTMPAVEAFGAEGRLGVVDASGSIEEVAEQVRNQLSQIQAKTRREVESILA